MVATLLDVLLSFTAVELAVAQTEYQNAEGHRGTCVVISNCPTLYSLFNSEPLSPLIIEFLRRSKCEFDESNQSLCCVKPATDTVTDIDEQPNNELDLKSHSKASLLPLDSCGLDRRRIWEGSHVKPDEFPWIALLQLRKFPNLTGFHCGGVVINKRYVLTVAHCVHEPSAFHSLTMVRLGENDLSWDPDCEIDTFSGRLWCAPPVQDFGIEEVIVHPESAAARHMQHDIALIRLDRDAKLDTPYVKPICLPTMADVEIGKELLIAGWGTTNTGDKSQIKLKVEVPAMSISECHEAFVFEIGEGHMCAGGVAGKDACDGDSGMPLMDWIESMDGSRRYSVVGLVSYGIKCGYPGRPTVYTKVSYYIPWILENIQS